MIAELSSTELFFELLDTVPTSVAMKHFPDIFSSQQPGLMLEAINRDYNVYFYLPDEVKLDRFFAKEAIAIDRRVMNLLPQELEEDKGFMKDLLFTLKHIEMIEELNNRVEQLEKENRAYSDLLDLQDGGNSFCLV